MGTHNPRRDPDGAMIGLDMSKGLACGAGTHRARLPVQGLVENCVHMHKSWWSTLSLRLCPPEFRRMMCDIQETMESLPQKYVLFWGNSNMSNKLGSTK